jgi:hypothetical protein
MVIELEVEYDEWWNNLAGNGIISFDEVHHRYKYRENVLDSVSAIVKYFFPYTGKEVPQIEKEVAMAKGTKVHKIMETAIRNPVNFKSELTFRELADSASYIKYLLNMKEDIRGTEVRMAIPSLGIAGTADLILYCPKKQGYIIGDWKTNKSLDYPPSGLARYSMSDYENSALTAYQFQLSVYAEMFEHIFGERVVGIKIINLAPSGEVKEYDLPKMSVGKALEEYYNQVICNKTQENQEKPQLSAQNTQIEVKL